MAPESTILLIGARGCGKTTLGRALAQRLALPFTDLDDHALRILGAPSVREAWRRHGEGAWRAAEAQALSDLLNGRVPGRGVQGHGRGHGREGHGQGVVALGGGAPMIDAAREAIAERRLRGGVLVAYLACPAPELVRRLREQEGDRPRLSDLDLEREVAQVLATREAVYRAMADLIVEMGAEPVERSLERLAEVVTRCVDRGCSRDEMS